MENRKLIVFDLDDTLYDQSFPFIEAWNDCFDYDVDLDQLYLDSRKVNNMHYSKVLDHSMSITELGCLRIMKPLKDRGITISNQQAMDFQQKYAYYQGNLHISDIMENILDYLKLNHIEIAILSNGLKKSQKHKLNGLKMEKWFDQNHIFVSETIGFAKPDRQAFQYIEKKLGYSACSCIYIGDSYVIDVQGAMNALWQPIYFNRRKYQYNLDQNVLEVHTEKELENILRKIAGDSL